MQDSLEKAMAVFRNPYNCAQTVCHAFGRADLLEPMQTCARGNAPGGLCGALYGATQVAPGHAEEIKAAFAARNGALTCRELKAAGKVPCPVCVRTAVELLNGLGF